MVAPDVVSVQLKHGLLLIDQADWDREITAHTIRGDVSVRPSLVHWLSCRDACGCTYAHCRIKGFPDVRIHRLLMGLFPGQFADHRNRNGLDNRRENLRLCTQQENNRNARRSPCRWGFRGVWCFPRKDGTARFLARIKVNDKQINVGTYATAEEAAQAYDAAAIRLHGEFAYLNFPLKAAG